MDERQSSSKPAKAQGAEQPSKKFALGARIPKKPKQARTEYTHVDKNCELCKKHGGTHTTLTPWSVAGTTKMELLRWVLSGRLHESLARIVVQRSPTPRSWLAWKNLRSLSRKPIKKARNVTVVKKAAAIPTRPEVLGRVVPGKMKIDVRK